MTTTVWKAEPKGAAAKRSRSKKTVKPVAPAADPPKEPDRIAWISVSTITHKEISMWLRVTSLKTGWEIFVPLPIRLIQVIPAKDGTPGGCLVRGAHGDETTTKEGVLEILGRLNGAPLGGASEWRLAE